MKATIKSGALGIDIEAIDGQVALTVTRLVQGQPGQADALQCISTLLSTEQAAVFADTFVGMACIAEEQAYHRDVERAYAAAGVPVPPRDLAVWARHAADAAEQGDIPIPAVFAGARH